MPIVTRKEAMKLTGKSHATLYRHLKSGKLSKSQDGGIDTNELLRVYGPFVNQNEPNDTNPVVSPNVVEMYQKESSDTETKMLKEQIELLRSQLSDTKYQLERSQNTEDKLFTMLQNRLPPPNENSVVNRLKKKFL